MITQVPSEQRNWAMAAHLSALIALVGFPFGHVVGPLVVHLAKGGEYPFVGEHSKASLNYQITVSIGATIGIIVAVVLFFCILLAAGASGADHSDAASTAAGLSVLVFWLVVGGIVAAFAIASIIFIIMGTVAANEGRTYTYPFAIRFLR